MTPEGFLSFQVSEKCIFHAQAAGQLSSWAMLPQEGFAPQPWGGIHLKPPRCPTSLPGCIPEDPWAGLSCSWLFKRQKALLSHGSHPTQPQPLPRGGSAPPRPLQLHPPGSREKQITPVLGLTCLHSYSKPCFHIYNSFSNIFKQISHCWKNVKGLI